MLGVAEDYIPMVHLYTTDMVPAPQNFFFLADAPGK
jgi:hypothetical protein